eukprot:352642-Chlamydomonas_euryale.AAC.4
MWGGVGCVRTHVDREGNICVWVHAGLWMYARGAGNRGHAHNVGLWAYAQRAGKGGHVHKVVLGYIGLCKDVGICTVLLAVVPAGGALNLQVFFGGRAKAERCDEPDSGLLNVLPAAACISLAPGLEDGC